MASHSNMADDYSLSRVPKEARVPMWEILVIRIGAFTSLSQFILGAFLGYGMSFWDAALASFLGAIILEVVILLIGIAGAREGLSTSMLSRWTGFGKYGSSIIGFVIAISTIGWFGVQNSVFANGINDAFGGALGFPLAATLTGLFVTVIVIFGFKWLGVTAKIAVPGFLLTIAYGIYQVFDSHSLPELMSSSAPGPALSLGAAATMVAGSFMVGAVLTPDMTRYCRSSKDVLWSTLISVVIGEIIINLIAVLMAHAVKTSDVVTIALQTSGWLGAATVIFATVKINDINLYSASLGFTNIIHALFGKNVNRGLITLIVGMAGTILSVLGILDQFVNFLIFLGVWIPPIAGIMVVDYFILKRSRQVLDESRMNGELPAVCETWNPVALVAWALGFGIGYLIQWGIPSINSLAVAGVVYFVGMKVFGAALDQKWNVKMDKAG
ncbi:purine-cytosine permease family protein [Brevibacillus choshinensis]|uniref:Cytosine permease n=1 Tax=Brevibacillus choshinensis TaxID=54911 RepID=A0ABX7FWG1_BRECH|nr:cytosine permease [Brevibacillus choshinensis]QRG70214.1 cytosine permease [Brevibacillus choshinensis]